jgi:N utilization substance protein A
VEGITFDENTISYIGFFQRVTGAIVKDCIDAEDRIVFVVEPGFLGMAVGKKGEIAQKLRRMMKKDILVVEYSDDPSKFIANVFHQFGVQGVELEDRPRGTHATVKVEPSLKGKAIGRGGSYLKLARQIVRRHHPIDSISVD